MTPPSLTIFTLLVTTDWQGSASNDVKEFMAAWSESQLHNDSTPTNLHPHGGYRRCHFDYKTWTRQGLGVSLTRADAESKIKGYGGNGHQCSIRMGCGDDEFETGVETRKANSIARYYWSRLLAGRAGPTHKLDKQNTWDHAGMMRRRGKNTAATRQSSFAGIFTHAFSIAGT